VVVDFPNAPWSVDYAQNIRIAPAVPVTYRWENDKKLIITPQKFWSPQTNYQVVLPQYRTILLAKVETSQLNFSTVSYPRVTNVAPADGEQNVALDMESPITVNLDQGAQDFFLKAVLDPAAPIVYQPNADRTEFKFLPSGPVADGQKYDLKIYAKYAKADDSTYFQIFESSFQTLTPDSIVWAKDFPTRLDQARRYTRPQITTGKYIDINLSQQIMTIFQDGQLLDAYMISSGKPAMPTPKGTFKIENKAPRAWSAEFGLYMPWWNALVPSGAFGIHELPEWPNGYKEGAAHLGTPVSHGCIRLGVGPAKFVYDWAPIGTPVVIY
jgi:hypothetical protein